MAIHEVFPYLRLRNTGEAVEWYKRIFGAEELFRLVEPSGRVGHIELRMGGTTLMFSDEYPEMNIAGPETLGGTTFAVHLHVDDADALIDAAVAAGATLLRPAQDHFYGERSGTFRDPWGHEWNVGHELEKLTPEQMQARYDALFE
ncbi:MAG: VOC family protein [Myxococcales bacterium]|nr:VOC family protein [Myxococcales bacterium]